MTPNPSVISKRQPQQFDSIGALVDEDWGASERLPTLLDTDANRVQAEITECALLQATESGVRPQTAALGRAVQVHH